MLNNLTKEFPNVSIRTPSDRGAKAASGSCPKSLSSLTPIHLKLFLQSYQNTTFRQTFFESTMIINVIGMVVILYIGLVSNYDTLECYRLVIMTKLTQNDLSRLML